MLIVPCWHSGTLALWHFFFGDGSTLVDIAYGGPLRLGCDSPCLALVRFVPLYLLYYLYFWQLEQGGIWDMG